VDEPLTVIISRNGLVRARAGHGLDLADVNYKTGDGPYAIFETRSVHHVAIFDTTGRVFSVECSELPPGARFAQAADAQPGKRYLVANSSGYGFIVKSEDLLTRVKAGKGFMTLEEGDEVIRPAPVPAKPEMAVC